MAIKIAIAGTHSTGKTSFIESVQSKLREKGCTVKKVSDLATEARKHGFPILREHTFSSTLWIMTRCINLELEGSLSADMVLVDRPVHDAYGYLLAALKHRNESLTEDEMAYLESLVTHHARTYQFLFKTTIDETRPINSAKERDMDRVFRSQVAGELDSLFLRLKICCEALSHDRAVASDQISRLVEMCLKAKNQKK
jgi:hypothetical protein